MISRINELKGKRANIVAQARAYLDKADAEKRAMNGEEQSAWDKAHKDIDAITADIEKLEKQLESERRFTDAKPVAEQAQDTAEKRSEKHSRAYRSWLARGMAALNDEERSLMERRDLTTATSTPYAGYTIPTAMANDLERDMKAFGGILQVATILKTAQGNTLTLPSTSDVANSAAILAETSQNTGTTTGTFGRVQLGSYMLVTDIIKVSVQLLRDSAFNIDAEIRSQLAERLGRGLNTYCTTGTGSDQHNGIVTAATVGVTTASASALTVDELIDLYHSVDVAYRDKPTARWMFADSTLKAIRKLKDGEGRYIWQPSLMAGAPNSILEKPYVVNNDMAAITNSAKVVLFGDMSKYVVRLVGDVAVVRMDEKYAEYLEVGFMGFQASDADLRDAGNHPVKVLQMKA